MAKLMIAPLNQADDEWTFQNDILGVYEDSHIFSSYEQNIYDFLTVSGTRQDVQQRLSQIQPRVAVAYDVGGKWTFEEPNPVGETLDVWTPNDGKNWYQLKEAFRFPVNIGVISAEEKQFLTTFDINHPSVDATVKKLAKNLVDANPENSVHIKSLRNQEPQT